MEKIAFSLEARLLLSLCVSGALSLTVAQDDASKMCAHVASLAVSAKKDEAWKVSFGQAVRSAEYLINCGAKAADAAPAGATNGDKQVGASGGTGGSTSLVSHGFAPSLLGFAFESGGIERDISGSVVTLRANPATLLSALAKKYGPGIQPSEDPLLNTLSRVNLAATFDTSRTAGTGGGAENPFRANYQQLTEFSVRAAIWNGRDPFRRKNWVRLNQLAAEPDAVAAATAARDILGNLGKDEQFRTSVVNVVDRVAAAQNNSEATAALASYNEFIHQTVQRLLDSDSAFAGKSKTFRESSQKLAEKRAKLYKEIDSQAVVNIEYALFRPPAVTDGQTGSTGSTAASTNTTTGLNANPDISALRLVGTWKYGATDLSWNAAATFFNSTRPGMQGRFRDFNTGGSASIALGSLPNLGGVTATLAARYMHLHQKPLGADVFFNSTKINTPGNIRWFQGKLTFPGPGKGVKIPLSVTFSNRTELIDEKDVRVNLGFSFDLDAIMRSNR